MSLDKNLPPRQNRVREALGRIYEHQPPYFREYLRKYQEDPTSRVFAPLAEEYRRLGRLDEAIEVCKSGLRHHPDFHSGRVTLAKCLIDKKSFPEARAELERVAQNVPENLLAQRLLGDVCVSLGDSSAALHSYKMALILAPNDVGLAERIRSLEKGTPAPAPTFEMPKMDVEKEFAAEIEPLETAPTPLPANTKPEPAPRQPEIDLSGPDLPPLWDGYVTPTGTESSSTPTRNLDGPRPSLQTDGSTGTGMSVEELFGQDDDTEAFTTEHVSAVFSAPEKGGKREITTETLGDLYYSQGQFDRALRIFENIADISPSRDIERKLDACRMKLGVASEDLLKKRQIETLKGLLSRVKTEPSPKDS